MKLIADMEKRVRLMDIVKEAGLVSVVSMALKVDSTMAAKTIDAMSYSAMSASESDSAGSRRSATESANGAIEFFP